MAGSTTTVARTPTWPSHQTLLISGLGDHTGGGLFEFDGRALSQIDSLSSTGLTVAGDRLIRLLWSPDEANSVGEVLVYDPRGVLSYSRVDALREPHGVLWDGTHMVAVSTGSNEILWMSAAGVVERAWRAPGDDDSWHLNSLLLYEGRLLASAFGRSSIRRGWSADLKKPSGVVFDVASGEEVLCDLVCPHNPTRLGDGWVVCWSSTHQLVEMDELTGRPRRSLLLNGWTRGLAVAGDLIVVGESANRADPSSGESASIALISRSAWAVVARVSLPCQEVYDLVFADPALGEATRRGFRTNAHRLAESEQFGLFNEAGVSSPRLRALGEPIPAAERRADISATFPEALEVGSRFEIECSIHNVGSAIFASSLPNPVQIAYRWLDPVRRQTISSVEPVRSRLPRALTPGASVACRVRVQAPTVPGEFLLRLTLVQEHVAWFDDNEDARLCEGLVRIRQPTGGAR